MVFVRVAGIAVDSPSRGRPAIRLVVVDDATGLPEIELAEDYPSNGVNLAVQLHDAAEAVRSRLGVLGVDRVVVRRADRPPVASNADGPRYRLLMEGAATSAARSVVVDTRIGTGADTGGWFGSNKATLDTAAQQLVDRHQLHARYREATAAALAGTKAP